MIAVPAIDLRDGACVQLVGGRFDDERVRLSDPVAVAHQWAELGFARLHVVDLDAAMRSGSNDAMVDALITATNAAVQVGGGVRSQERVEHLLDAGAARVVLGTRALQDRDWLAEQARRFPDRVVVAADIRGGRLAVDGWTGTLEEDVFSAIAGFNALPLAGVLVTAVDAEGQMRGPATELLERVVGVCEHSVFASGGVTSLDDLRMLDALGV